jgi:DNA-binding response OmpR family regulator
MRLLIIEDEEDIVIPVKSVLERKGYVVDFALEGKKGLYLAHVNKYDCILLDLNLPGLNGIALSKELRAEQNNVPIVMVTARSQLMNKLEGFDAGADDYVTKPFDLKELLARIKAVIQRNSLNKLKILKFNDFELLPDQNKLIQIVRNSHKNKSKKKNKAIILSNKETAILEYLIRNKQRIVSTEELLEHIWGDEIDEFSETIKTHIKTLRQKIDPNKEIITTVRGKGYIIME